MADNHHQEMLWILISPADKLCEALLRAIGKWKD
jgi:hypothetical protein